MQVRRNEKGEESGEVRLTSWTKPSTGTRREGDVQGSGRSSLWLMGRIAVVDFGAAFAARRSFSRSHFGRARKDGVRDRRSTWNDGGKGTCVWVENLRRVVGYERMGPVYEAPCILACITICLRQPLKYEYHNTIPSRVQEE